MFPSILTDVVVLVEEDVEEEDEEVSSGQQLCQTLPSRLLRLQTSGPSPACQLPRMGRRDLKKCIKLKLAVFFSFKSFANVRKLCGATKRLAIKNIKDRDLLELLQKFKQ